ncbi:hypothetical protein BU23DRAFT_602822 [Bimuria novae-zelandiae CBS 107.79]|uniref:Uncharacterized protein n=1 Tax=Bimuria novae-zelandiae CBS 107.79 TaxID=1447943 RepID=A0A6A5US38_9PLEO|nr:hypothetical protein BU23DRAFT_602822 [Bimuria novae-zelandiae CBS 107.79]
MYLLTPYVTRALVITQWRPFCIESGIPAVRGPLTSLLPDTTPEVFLVTGGVPRRERTNLRKHSRALSSTPGYFDTLQKSRIKGTLYDILAPIRTSPANPHNKSRRRPQPQSTKNSVAPTTTMASEKDAPPSYTSSLSPSSTNNYNHNHGQSLLDTLTLTRATTLSSTIHTSILPILTARAALGLPCTTLALLPSDIPLPPPPEKSEFSFDGYAGAARGGEEIKVITGADGDGDEEVQVVRLAGEQNSTAFWRGRGVVQELERGLREVLGASTPAAQSVRVEEVQQKKDKKKGLFGRGKKEEVEREEVGEEAEGGEQVVVRVRVEEICLRTMNEFGLYDTVNRVCVVVRVDARC